MSGKVSRVPDERSSASIDGRDAVLSTLNDDLIHKLAVGPALDVAEEQIAAEAELRELPERLANALVANVGGSA